jgi:WD40 repeat protein
MSLSILPLLLGLVVTQVARLQERSPGEIATLKLGWNQEANFVALSPDGRLLASAGYSSDIRIWDVTTARRLYTLKGHSARAITFSPDGKLLASSAGSVVRLWDVQSGKQQVKLEIPIDSGIDLINLLAFRPDGKKLVGAGTGTASFKQGTVLISWDTGTGKVTESDKLDNDEPGHRLWLSADGGALARLVSARGDRGGPYFLRVRDLASKKEFDISSKEPFSDDRFVAALSPDGKAAAIGNVLWDVTTGKQLVALRTESLKGIRHLSFSPDGKFVAAIGDWENRTSIGLYKVKTGDVVFAFKAHEGEVYSLAISRNGQTMASVSKDQTLKLWDLDP